MIDSLKESNEYVDRDNLNRSPASVEDEQSVNNSIPLGKGAAKGTLNTTTAGVRRISSRGKAPESMESTQGDSLDSELDLEGEDDDDGSDLDSEDELELVNLTSIAKKPEDKPEAGLLSDDDF